MRRIAAVSLGCVLTACGGPASNSAASCAEPDALYVYAKAPTHKLHAYASPSATQAKDSIFPVGTRFVAVVFDACTNRGAITKSIESNNGRTRSGVRSYAWNAPRDMTPQELARAADQDACLHSLDISPPPPTAPAKSAIAMHRALDVPTASDAELDSLALPDDPKVEQQQHLKAIGAAEAYDIFYKPGSGITKEVVIAIIDSGVDLDHEDLKPHLWKNPGEIPGNGIDDDGNGYVDDVNGYNMASNLPSPFYEKTSLNGAWQYAHGTKVAGLAAAVAGNERGVSGVMGTAKIMALNNMGKDTFMDQIDTANAIRYAVDNGASVINLSLGSSTAAGSDYRNALKYATAKGVVVLAAAGNENGAIGQNYSAAGVAASLPGLISVGNIKASDLNKSATSNYSTTFVELAAPGTYTQSTGLLTTAPGDSYSNFSGTSAATPVASGAAALAIGLIKSRGYLYSSGEIESLLTSTAKLVPSLTSYFKGGRALDLAALARAIDKKYPPRDAGLPPVAIDPDPATNSQKPGTEMCTIGESTTHS